MRKIKFRGYHPSLNDDVGIMEYDVENLFDCPSMVLMQFTGLKDKNGKEIYEGDIFKVKLKGGQEYKGKIVWGEEDCGFNLDCGLTGMFLFVMAEEGEVVGNIYETPELLKGDNK